MFQWALAVGLFLVLVLGLSQPQSQSALQTLGYNWLSPLGPVRLLALPIAHKYNLQGTVSRHRSLSILQTAHND